MFAKRSFFYLLSVLSTVLAQSTTAYTDPDTGIIFQRFITTSAGGWSFGIAFPATAVAESEFIGQIVAPISHGWGGVSFGGGMVSNLLFVTWPNDAKTAVVPSFRYVNGYLEPGVYTGNAVQTKMYTKFNSTHYSYTFRCQNCATWTNGGFDATADFVVMGWAASALPVGDKTNSASSLQYHDTGFGQYGVILTGARQAQYAAWLAAAGVGGGTSTTTTISSTTTVSVTTPTSTAVIGTYDYIVVGGGAAGLVVADRLSESGKSVMLIERGPPTTFKSGGTVGPAWLAGKGLTRFDVPGLCNQIWVDSAGIACNDIDQMAGCVLGGGTAVNAGLFFKPTDRDWNDNFPTGWKSTDMVSSTNKVFTRIPSTDNPSQNGIRYLQEPYNVLSTVLKPAGWTEVVANQVPNQKNRTFSRTPFMYSNGERGGPLATYLQTAKARSNFKLLVNSTVTKVFRTGARITGVQITATTPGGSTGIVNVTPNTGRVVLSAGAFGTPKILFRSGIGPTDQLNVVKASTDGPTMIDQTQWIRLPVGYNVLDHTNTDLVFSQASIKSYDFYGAYNSPNTTDRDLYLNNRAGILATAAPGPNAMMWESFVGTDGIARQLQWTARAEGSLGESGSTLVTMSQYLGTGVVSRGRMTIASNLNMQISTSPYLNNAADKDVVIRGVQSMLSAASGKNGITFLQPAAGVTATQFVNNYIESRRSNHWIGTCKMGTNSGLDGDGTTGSVVDTNTKVYGTDNLFVVDASIFPGHVTTNPSAPIMIAAEKAVEKILALAPPGVAKWSQCGGINYTGATNCASGLTCTVLNPYYYQCL